MFAKEIDGRPERLFVHIIRRNPTKRSWRPCCRGSQNESDSAGVAGSQHSGDIGTSMGVGSNVLYFLYNKRPVNTSQKQTPT